MSGSKANDRRGVLTVCVILATVMQTLDTTIANVALPYMQGSMAASQEEIDWVLTSYIVAAAIMTAPTGYLAARFGRRRLFLISVLGFTVASVLCGLAQSLSQIVMFRVMQGLCGAALVPLSQSTLLDVYPIEQRGFAMGLWTIGALLGPILGPTLGGWLTENYSWRWVFYINIPVGLLTALGLLAVMDETALRPKVRLDWLGFGALSLAVGSFQTMLDRGETLDWFSSQEIIAEACLAGIGFYIFLVQSVLAPQPFLSPRLFRDVNFVVGITLYFVVGLILYSTLALLAPYLQVLMNYPVYAAGLVLAPRGIGSMIAALACGRLIRHVDPRLLLTFGFTMSAYAQYMMTQWTPNVSQITVIYVGFIQGIGISSLSVPLTTVTFSTLSGDLRTEGTGVYSLMRNLGSAIGISVTSALLERNSQVNHAIIATFVTPFSHALHQPGVEKFWNAATAQGLTRLNSEVSRQASIIAYVDDFKLMLILALCAFPLTWLIKPNTRP